MSSRRAGSRLTPGTPARSAARIDDLANRRRSNMTRLSAGGRSGQCAAGRRPERTEAAPSRRTGAAPVDRTVSRNAGPGSVIASPRSGRASYWKRPPNEGLDPQRIRASERGCATDIGRPPTAWGIKWQRVRCQRRAVVGHRRISGQSRRQGRAFAEEADVSTVLNYVRGCRCHTQHGPDERVFLNEAPKVLWCVGRTSDYARMATAGRTSASKRLSLIHI